MRKFPKHRAAAEKARKELEGPPLPDEVAYLWQWFCDMVGGESLTHTEISAWSELNRIHLEPREVEVIRQLDRIRSRVSREAPSA